MHPGCPWLHLFYSVASADTGRDGPLLAVMASGTRSTKYRLGATAEPAVSAGGSRESDSEPAPLLLSLPDHLLALVASWVQGKNGLRATCRSLRLAVNACTSALTWTRPSTSTGETWRRALLPASLAAACPGFRLLDCGGRKEDATQLEFCLASCPPSIQTLHCGHTKVGLLGPLVTCTMLQTLDLGGCTAVEELSPLAACMMLQTLDCRRTLVAALGPLSACSKLHTLDCGMTRVSDLGPLSACTMLQTLYFSWCRAADLGPLSACTMLQSLDCSSCWHVADLGPLPACTLLRTLNLNSCREVRDLVPLSACTMLQTLNCGATQVVDLAPLSACTMLQTLNFHATTEAQLGPPSACTMLQTLYCFATKVADMGPLSACTMLQSLDCHSCPVAEPCSSLSPHTSLGRRPCVAVAGREPEARVLAHACQGRREGCAAPHPHPPSRMRSAQIACFGGREVLASVHDAGGRHSCMRSKWQASCGCLSTCVMNMVVNYGIHE